MRCVWLALLLLSALGVCAEPQSAQLVPASDHDVALLRSAGEEAPQQFEEFVESATLSAAFSGCGLCQQTGQCDHAFRGQPGQFCIGLTSGAPCCCPRDAQCAASPYECRCRRVVPSYHYGGDDYHPSSSSGGVSGTLIFFALLLLCCVCCCYLPARRAQQEREEQFVYAQPVATGQYGTYPAGQAPQAPYTYASAPVAYESSPYHESGGVNTMAAGALGALGGLGVGAAVGSMLGGHNNNNNNNSGYSGDVGGVSDNTYTFSGDTGGDFGGDGGDDGTFAGDS
ncbi:hypothetical protein PF005_g20995 [Phytophthora fragariae]|uniref:EGF-like domain-containing protein n=1 Tax=Phytophthora fragariae TaxID=53985 RepID=A0A6A3E2L7_9STRA|nr:hypothetical protein PF003_g33564 [Phytophthora fragariae]KAE8927805.1 hypothetical protein PF009_g22037 [Phytophthora fragariae]KAE8987027.1 hypothetical protein PF011_g19744 [Phytophthora fragariae]KAE9085529.1 hypothetical protein PF010_g20427 [Phytophthora fragariae]KAE9085551.1 hypothetical protein PF007_g21103 [Phytophthora fragariae]